MAGKVKDLMDALKGPVSSELLKREGARKMKPIRSADDQPLGDVFVNEDQEAASGFNKLENEQREMDKE